MRKLCLLLTLALLLFPAVQAEEATPIAPQSDVLVAYFSCTGNTEAAALLLAEALGADVYAITPAQPYTQADLNYHQDDSRANQEMGDPDARPAIAGEPLACMNAYQTIFLGYPIWWGQAPRIISTFLESYDLSGKTLVPFCTSGGSGIAGSLAGLRELAPAATVLDGARLNHATAESVAQWLAELEAEAAP